MNKEQQIMDLLALCNSPYPKREERTKQEIALDNVRDGQHIIGSIDVNGTLSFSVNPVVHATSQSARSECKRLALANPGKAFVFVKLAGAELVPNKTVSI